MNAIIPKIFLEKNTNPKSQVNQTKLYIKKIKFISLSRLAGNLAALLTTSFLAKLEKKENEILDLQILSSWHKNENCFRKIKQVQKKQVQEENYKLMCQVYNKNIPITLPGKNYSNFGDLSKKTESFFKHFINELSLTNKKKRH